MMVFANLGEMGKGLILSPQRDMLPILHLYTSLRSSSTFPMKAKDSFIDTEMLDPEVLLC